ncbi:MAG: DUF2892 domain-containing protein [Spirochaetales bacterium]
MIVNMGKVDRAIRLILAAVFIVLILTGSVGGTLSTILGILSVVFILTSVIRFCPLYVPLKINTDKDAQKQE